MSAGLSERQQETAEDRRFYLEIGFTPVLCEHCGVEAMVKKNSRKHTSVQWTGDGVAACPEISTARADNPHTLVLGCARLNASIDRAVRDGAVVVPDV